MATPEAIHCIGCAKDISKSSSRERRKLGPDSTGNPVARKQALSGWNFLFRKQLQLHGISEKDVMLDLDDPGKMCKLCFMEFKKYHNLQAQLEGSLSAVLQHMKLSFMDTTATATATNTSIEPSTPPQSKRPCSHPMVSLSDSSSPSVMVTKKIKANYSKTCSLFILSGQYRIQKHIQELPVAYTTPETHGEIYCSRIEENPGRPVFQ